MPYRFEYTTSRSGYKSVEGARYMEHEVNGKEGEGGDI